VGAWADVPKTAAAGAGTLTLELSNHYTLTRAAATGGYGGARLDRVHCRAVEIDLARLIVRDAEEDFSGDEPYLWTIWFKIDGDRFDLRDRNRGATVVSTSGSHRNLGESAVSMRPGAVVAIPDRVGRFGSVLKTLRGLDPLSPQSRDRTTFGMIAVAMEEDGLSDGAIEAGRRAFVSTLQNQLDRAVRTLSEPDMEELKDTLKEATEEAIKAHGVDVVRLAFNDGPDDSRGERVIRRSFTQLVSTEMEPLELHFDEGGHYEVQGTLTAF
jgi:hypothetical protein